MRRLLLTFALLVVPAAAGAQNVTDHIKVEHVVSPGGIDAWLVETHAVPIVALNVAFESGSRFDPPVRKASPA